MTSEVAVLLVVVFTPSPSDVLRKCLAPRCRSAVGGKAFGWMRSTRSSPGSSICTSISGTDTYSLLEQTAKESTIEVGQGRMMLKVCGSSDYTRVHMCAHAQAAEISRCGWQI